MNPRARSAPKFRERIETLTIALTVVRFRPTMFVFVYFIIQKVEVEDLYTWPFKLTQNMVQKNNDKIKFATLDPKRFNIFPPLTGGCSEGLGAF